MLREIVEGFGCILLFLPPYSPDFNPIEGELQLWYVLKGEIHEQLLDYLCLFYSKTMDLAETGVKVQATEYPEIGIA